MREADIGKFHYRVVCATDVHAAAQELIVRKNAAPNEDIPFMLGVRSGSECRYLVTKIDSPKGCRLLERRDDGFRWVYKLSSPPAVVAHMRGTPHILKRVAKNISVTEPNGFDEVIIVEELIHRPRPDTDAGLLCVARWNREDWLREGRIRPTEALAKFYEFVDGKLRWNDADISWGDLLENLFKEGTINSLIAGRLFTVKESAIG